LSTDTYVALSDLAARLVGDADGFLRRADREGLGHADGAAIFDGTIAFLLARVDE
jgi:hypothetical protein